MTVDRKKELKQLYKQMKPEMGIFIIRALDDGRCYLQATPNLKGTINATKFKLDAGRHPHRELEPGKSGARILFLRFGEAEYDR